MCDVHFVSSQTFRCFTAPEIDVLDLECQEHREGSWYQQEEVQRWR
jgi:hypothetical protein